MDTKELDRIYIELQKRCDARRITKEQIDNITNRFNKAYDSYIEFRKISYMTPIYTNELKAMRKLDYLRKKLKTVKTVYDIDPKPFLRPGDYDIYLAPLIDINTHLNIGIVIQHYKIYDDDPDRVSYIDEAEKYLLDFPDRLKKDNPWFWR